MAFGDVYGYKTNSRSVVAFAEGDEFDNDGVNSVDLVLTGQSSGTARRTAVPVAADEGSAETNQAWPAFGS